MIPTIFYAQEAYSINHKTIMGRQAAGHSFVAGLLQNFSGDEIWFHGGIPNNLSNVNLENKDIRSIDKANLRAMNRSGLMYFPGPNIAQLAWERRLISESMWSICGITHTTSSDLIMDAITDLIHSPTRSWDAIICTSDAVKKHISEILNAQIEYLRSEIGLNKLNLPMFPVIPLGINTKEFSSLTRSVRKNYGISKDALVVLYLGRLSFHAKANPLQMYRSLKHAAKHVRNEIVLIECGWYSNKYIEDAFDEAFNQIINGVTVKRIKLDGTKQQVKMDALSMSDIFISLSDNIQETFGITPIEAMASGIPVIVSDWDGYKDTVNNDVGFKVPTVMPPSGLGTDIIARYALGIDNYDEYLGKTSSLISVSQTVLNEAILALAKDQNLRLQMGAAGKKRALNMFDWRTVIKSYENLWQEQAAIREKSMEIGALSWPARLDPFKGFSHYSTKKLTLSDVVRKTDIEIDDLLEIEMVNYNMPDFISTNIVDNIISKMPDHDGNVASILNLFEDNEGPEIYRTILWMLKVGIVEVVDE